MMPAAETPGSERTRVHDVVEERTLAGRRAVSVARQADPRDDHVPAG